ncbi:MULTISPECIES: DUF5946 family protein [Methanobacterium]|uniref:DUF5946 family protein n=1 Tax=Methanobacterium veterum TaxID=408577 RepID=A0A9E4ZU51_9EURY|nr:MULTISPECIES: DUF5946 family protein [Methanobacterium]MCZ3365677.1 DUF5946 family protein [Methanobacterium veterum]MCZ3371141.1 DUF5946 family protein [Methanobacterium veterum]
MNSEKPEQEMFYKLSCYTQAHPDPSFIHQHAVDAFGAQYADENTKPIGLAFALIGLYLYLEKDFTGREVQIAHVKLAKHRKEWPKFHLPVPRGHVTVYDVLDAPRGPKRDEMIYKWCISVWDAYSDSHEKVADLVQSELYNRQKKRKNLCYNPR